MVKGQKMKKLPDYWGNTFEKRQVHKKERKTKKKEIDSYLYENLEKEYFEQ